MWVVFSCMGFFYYFSYFSYFHPCNWGYLSFCFNNLCIFLFPFSYILLLKSKWFPVFQCSFEYYDLPQETTKKDKKWWHFSLLQNFPLHNQISTLHLHLDKYRTDNLQFNGIYMTICMMFYFNFSWFSQFRRMIHFIYE